MISDGVIKLVAPNVDLVPEFRLALIESYNEHKQFLGWATLNPSLEHTTGTMKKALLNFQTRENEIRFIIQKASNHRLIGCISLIVRNPLIPYYEIGYWSRTSDAGQGNMTKAIALAESYAVDELKVRRLEIKMAESNLASRRVAEKAGFKFEAVLQSDRLLPTGTIDNTCIYSKLWL